uniref:Transmembrane protein n=2 Tax=Phytophthora ramorum TaxID=164328 RepID=H3H155_PHYRM
MAYPISYKHQGKVTVMPPPKKRPPPPPQSLRAQAEAKYEVHLAERRQLEQERMSSYTDDAFVCESPHAMLASSRGVPPENVQTAGASPYLVVDNIGRLRVDSVSDSDAHEDVAYGELAQPRPEIILRWKRFAVLVVLTAATMSAIAAWLREGFVVDRGVSSNDAMNKVDTVNSYIGLIMGFIESFVGLGVEEIFPVFIVYLHNLRWYPGDDPATKKQSKFKKFALTIFIPAVMMAVGSSLSAVQANQKDDNTVNASANSTATRFLMQEATELEGGGLADSILKTALARKVDPMQPLDTSVCNAENEFSAETLLAAAPKAVFGFPLHEWGAEFANGWVRQEATKRYEVSYPGDAEQETVTLSEVMPLATAYELWLQGKSALLNSLRASGKDQVTAQPSSTGELLDGVFQSLLDMGLPLAENGDLDASFETLTLSSLMDLDTMTLKVPLSGSSNASVVCGDASCALLERQVGLGQRLPRKQIGMMEMKGNCSATANCDAIPTAAFLYGITTVTSDVSDQKSEATIAMRSLVLTFARLSWRFDTAAYECEMETSSGQDCHVLHHQLGDGDRHLVVPKQWLPAQLQAGTFSPQMSLVQLLEPKVKLSPAQGSRFATLEYLESWPRQEANSCSAAVDTYLKYVDTNHFYMGGDMINTMAASALLFIFQNARVMDSAPGVDIMTTQRRLVDTTTPRVKVFLTNTTVGNACTWTGCGVLLILTILVLVLPNERARISPPRGGNARAERFVAVQTEQVYPNLIYKKRFLIGKTGEEIKFGEFAVESVGLHHKMEEDEQIYI